MRSVSRTKESREIDRMAALKYIADGGERGRPCSYCATNARTLEKRGLVVKKYHPRGKASYVITEAGRQVLEP